MLVAVYVTNGAPTEIYVKTEIPVPDPCAPTWVRVGPGECAVVYTIKH